MSEQKVLPDWAVPETYEYDLGMATECENCGAALRDGMMIWRDVVPQMWQGKPLRSMLYCSEKCVLGEEPL